MDQVFELEKRDICCGKKIEKLLRPQNPTMKAKFLSPDESSVDLIVSSPNVACEYADMRSISFLKSFFALERCVAKSSSGQDSDD